MDGSVGQFHNEGGDTNAGGPGLAGLGGGGGGGGVVTFEGGVVEADADGGTGGHGG